MSIGLGLDHIQLLDTLMLTQCVRYFSHFFIQVSLYFRALFFY